MLKPVVAVVLLLALAVTAALGALSLRLPGLAATLVCAYLLAVAEASGLVLVLSPVHAVERAWLAVGQAVLLGLAAGVWWGLGRPRPRGDGARAALGSLRDPVLAVLAAVVAAAFLYELALGLSMPPNNWDSLTYHLSRAAAWLQHGGLYWIPNAPTDRVNEFQPGAEEQILYLFALTGKGSLWSLPQLLAEAGASASIYLAARRLGFAVAHALGAGLLFATFAIVALQSTTAQNDLVVAALAVAAAALLLGRTPAEDVLGGVALALAAGVKLTVVLAVPVLAALAVLGGRRALGRFTLGTVAGFAAVGMWGYVLNLVHTHHLLGYGQSREEDTTSPSLTGTIATAWRIVYRLVDLSGFSGWMTPALAGLGLGAGIAVWLAARRAGGRRERLLRGAGIAAPFLVPAAALGVAGLLHHAGDLVHLPVNSASSTATPFTWTVSRTANEDFSGFGPFGIAILATSLAVAVRSRRRDRVALAAALPLFVVLLALYAKYTIWLPRFLIVPVALSAPLLAGWFRRREVALGVAAVACLGLGLVHVRNVLKPVEGAATPPWELTQAEAVGFPWLGDLAQGLVGVDRTVPARGCVGALFDPDDPTYLYYGPGLDRRLVYLRPPGEARQARQLGLTTILVKTTDFQDAQGRLRSAGWSLAPQSRTVTVASRAAGPPAACGVSG